MDNDIIEKLHELWSTNNLGTHPDENYAIKLGLREFPELTKDQLSELYSEFTEDFIDDQPEKNYYLDDEDDSEDEKDGYYFEDYD